MRLGKLSLALGAVLCGSNVVLGLDLDKNDPESFKRAAQNAKELMLKYYHPDTPGTGIPGIPDAPYYWWEAGAMFGQLIHFWNATGDDSLNSMITKGLQFQVGDNNDFMPANQSADLGNDDQVFWGYAAMDAAELNFPNPPPDKPQWLALAQAVFNTQARRWDTKYCGGGLPWQIYFTNKGFDYKNSVSNAGFFQLAARLARYTGNQTYADWADKTYDWLESVKFVDETIRGGSMAMVFDGGHNQYNCTDINKVQFTYNAGMALAGCAYMYNLTNADPKWKARIDKLVAGTSFYFFVKGQGAVTTPGGVVQGGNILSEVSCESLVTDCDTSGNQDAPSFKAYLIRWMAVTAQLAPYTAGTIFPLLIDSAIGAAASCTGHGAAQLAGSTTACGRRWYQTIWDGRFGYGEQMSAMSVFQNSLLSFNNAEISPPVTGRQGGTSKGDPSAGSGENDQIPLPEIYTREITTGDKAGAAIITLFFTAASAGGIYFMLA